MVSFYSKHLLVDQSYVKSNLPTVEFHIFTVLSSEPEAKFPFVNVTNAQT
jgi:hypothetical protein